MDIAFLFESVEQQLEVTGKFERTSNLLTSNDTGSIKTVNSERVNDNSESSKRRNDEILVKKVLNKYNPVNESSFSGILDMVTGQPVHGRLEYDGGETYEGPFLHGLRHGDNAISLHIPQYGKGSKFMGSYRGDMPTEGLLVTESFTYKGTIKSKNNSHELNEYVFHGTGMLLKSNGHVYDGEFFYGKFHGAGKESEKDGKGVYTGSFENGERHGIGTYCRNSKKAEHDTGNLEDSNVEYCYSGVWSSGVKEGEGTETVLSSDEMYIGQFHNNNRHGFGILTKSPSDKYKTVTLEGKWRAGTSVAGGGWIITFPDGNKYMGEVDKEQKPHGKGTMLYKKGEEVYTGNFKSGSRHGEGLQVYLNGDKYEGIWADDRPVGSIHKLVSDRSNDETESEEKKEKNSPAVVKKGPDSENIGEVSGGSKKEPDEDANGASISKSGKTEDDLSAETSKDPSKTEEKTSRPNKEEALLDTDAQEEPSSSAPKIFYYPNGDSYTGVVDEDNQRQGHGRYTEQRTGSTYEGDWKDNMRHGKGVLLTATAKYSGEFVNDRREGHGTLISNDSSSYSGQFFQGAFHGVGTLCESNGRVYVGGWERGVRHGENCTETYADGTVFLGRFELGERHGFGTLVEHIGGKVLYSGDWSHNEMDGQGVRVWRDGALSGSGGKKQFQKYEGGLKNGQMSGHGTLTTQQGLTVEGEWQRNTPLGGQWKITYKDGSFFSGEAQSVRDGKSSSSSSSSSSVQSSLPVPHGFGTMKYKNGDEYSGTFVEGKRHGRGTCAFGNGDTWNGDWLNDSIDMNGNGELTMGDGTVHKFSSEDSG